MLGNIIFSNYFDKIFVQFCESFIFISKLLKFFACLAIANRLKFEFRITKFRSQIAIFFGWIKIVVVYGPVQTFDFLLIFPFFLLKIEPSLHAHYGDSTVEPNLLAIAAFLYVCFHLFINGMEWYRLPLAFADRSFCRDTFFYIIFPTICKGKQRNLSCFQCIFTSSSNVVALKMAGNSVWALYNTAASAEYKSVSLIWFFEEEFFGYYGVFCFYHLWNFN